jgi:hypothetical protein
MIIKTNDLIDSIDPYKCLDRFESINEAIARIQSRIVLEHSKSLRANTQTRKVDYISYLPEKDLNIIINEFRAAGYSISSTKTLRGNKLLIIW